jgi:hypothetical protein
VQPWAGGAVTRIPEAPEVQECLSERLRREVRSHRLGCGLTPQPTIDRTHVAPVDNTENLGITTRLAKQLCIGSDIHGGLISREDEKRDTEQRPERSRLR